MIATTVDESGTRRAVTKLVEGERLVSCTCCTSVCCMYPAAPIEIEYTVADLPDSVLFAESGNDGGFVEAVKDENGNFVIVDGFAAGQDVVIGISGIYWALWVEAGSGPEFIIGDYAADCLINWPFSNVNRTPAIQDQFEDTYQVTGDISGIVTRQSICVWTGDGLTLSNYNYQWRVNGRAKSGNQNTPVGSYADDYSVAL